MSEGAPGWFGQLADALTRTPGSPFPGMPLPEPGGQPRHSAVLALFGSGPSGDELLLTQRAATLRSHPGQVSFPGGRIDDTDAGPEAAALREAWEETGLDPAGVDVAGLGPRLYLSVTDFYVTPVLGWWRQRGELAVGDPAEVDRVVLARVSDLIDPAHRFTIAHPSGYLGPAFAASGLFIWGFTAGVITWMLRLAGLEQEWNSADVRQLPDGPIRGQRELDQWLGQGLAHADSAGGTVAGSRGRPGGQPGRQERLGVAE